MSGRRRLISAIITVLVALAARDAAALRASADAMECCAKTDYSCAGMSTPDDCCQRMHHAPAHATPSTAAAAGAVQGSPAIAVPPSPEAMISTRTVRGPLAPFTRPHDPPYLHAFSLLI
jgi:hypothetical protein